ncbi:protein JASON-like [Macadamia integrifolia]|uniref:protein JASON-like n=1 Tax=Macadamia integrifolia TaxID=60698 RepID=UPI001C4F0E0A|nr:protein JASON-like [Macadamia integrifolia]
MEEREDSVQTRTVWLSSPRSPWCDFGFFLGLLRRMGCFFGCFGVEDDERPHIHLKSDPVSSKKRDPLLPRNKLGSLLLSEEKESSPCKDAGCHTLESALLIGDGEVRELRDEVTPEIWKASEKAKDSPPCDGEAEPSRFYSWLPSSPVEKFQLEEQPDQDSISPVKLCEGLGEELGSPGHKPSSSTSKGELEEKNCTNEGSEFESPDSETRNHVPATGNKKLCSVIPEALAVDIQSKKKSVRFEFESEVESLPSNGEMLKQSDVTGSHNGSNRSPYPTPLRITDEMQTPGTIYLANVKNARIRSQYVYPVLNPVEDFSQWKELKKEDGNAYLEFGQQGESFDKCGPATPQCTSMFFSNKSEMLNEGAAIVSKEDLKLDASLVHWLKPSSSPEKDSNQSRGAWSIPSGKSPKMSNDRPILGMVAAHWNDDGLSHDSPKWQDGNGIPNSTRKYKEDQRVKWHATPFEERLQRALSEESNVVQRKLISENPIIFEENEETDTAGSGLHTST